MNIRTVWMIVWRVWMTIWQVWRRRKICDQSAAWHVLISRGLSETQRRAFEIWIAEPANAREFRVQRSLLDGVAELRGEARNALRSMSSPAQVKLARPPAAQFVSALRRLVTERDYAGIVEPLVAQEQHEYHHEYYEALRCGDMIRARWIQVRMYLRIGYGVFLALLASIAKLFRGAS